MDLARIATTIAIATGASALLATVITVPFTPARWWAWRLRKHVETVNAIDAEMYPSQRQALSTRTEFLTSKVAAAYAVPTDWQRYRPAIYYIVWVFSMAVTLGIEALLASRQFRDPDDIGWVIYTGVFLVLTAIIDAIGLGIAVFHSHRERQRFIAAGCPVNFMVKHQRPDPGRKLTSMLLYLLVMWIVRRYRAVKMWLRKRR
jgi:hypothetical protein